MNEEHPKNNGWYHLADELAQWRQQASERQIQDTILFADGWAERAGKRMLNVASNDYLGLAQSSFEGQQLPWGASASRLVVGNHPILSEFEQEFATFKKTESTIFFNSGYAANIGILAALMNRDDYIFSDRLNHASLIDGALLSRAQLLRYRHRDLNELEHMLKKVPFHKKKLIVTDSLFSMDGSLAPIADLIDLKHRYGAWLFVDEAHSGGVYGDEGQGYVAQLQLSEHVELQMGTFSKAYGRFGAYLACSDEVRQYLLNRARSLIYTTGLPPIFIASIRDNWQRVRTERWRSQHVLQLAETFRKGLQKMGFETGESESQIVPFIIGSNEQTLAWERALQARGILAVAIRPPTVPQGAARIRFTWTAAHQLADVQWVLYQMAQIMEEMKSHDGAK